MSKELTDRIAVLESALKAAYRHMTHPSQIGHDCGGLDDHPIVMKANARFEKDLAEVREALGE